MQVFGKQLFNVVKLKIFQQDGPDQKTIFLRFPAIISEKVSDFLEKQSYAY